MQRSVGEVRRVNFDCNKTNMGEYAFHLFMSLFSQFLEFWLFVEGLSWPLIRISLSLLLKALQNFVIFVIFAIFETL